MSTWQVAVLCDTVLTVTEGQKLIDAMQQLTEERVQLLVSNTIRTLPDFDIDKNTTSSSQEVFVLKATVTHADALIILTAWSNQSVDISPELNNAFRWLCHSKDLRGKPTIILYATMINDAARNSLTRAYQRILVDCEALVLGYISFDMGNAAFYDQEHINNTDAERIRTGIEYIRGFLEKQQIHQQPC
jgi:NAD(P)H-dependent FMN reductase